MGTPRSWEKLVSAILGLPGVGPKMAERAALFLLRRPDSADALIQAVTQAQNQLRRCPLCGDFVETEQEPEPCDRCTNPQRDGQLMCVVEEVGDLAALERCRAFSGRYHVLGGVLSPLDGVGPDDLRIDVLLERVATDKIEEVILATNPTVEGETTATFLAELLRARGVAVTRLASGLPSGSVIQYADEHTLAQALTGRRAMTV